MKKTKDQIADARLQKIFGITLWEYNQLLKRQAGVCAICKHPPVKYRLAVDHDHKFDRIKIAIRKDGKSWKAWAIGFAEVEYPSSPVPGNKSGNFSGLLDHITRKDVKQYMKTMIRRRSIRGLLCMSCNKGLQYYRDDPKRFDAAAAYLRKFQEGL